MLMRAAASLLAVLILAAAGSAVEGRLAI